MSFPMKVLHTAWSARFGGIEKLLLDLARHFQDETDVEMSILLGKAEGELIGPMERAAKCFDLALAGGWVFSPEVRRRAVDIMRTHDVLHMHTYTPLVASAAAASGRPIIYTEHGNFAQGRRKTLGDHVKRVMLRRFLNGPADFITFNSSWTRRIAEARYGLAGKDRAVIFNGIYLGGRPDAESPEVRRIRARFNGSFIVGTTSRFAGFKRVDRLIEGFARFQEGRQAVLFLVGDGPLRNKYEQLARDLAIHDKTVFAGYRSDVATCQKAMDVCVFPSENEPFGIAALEALSLGKPVLIFRSAGGMREIIEPLEPRDVISDIPSLSERLGDYYDARDRLEEEGERRTAWANQFDIAVMAGRMKSIYGKVSQGKNFSC
jgi:glycosyltransferase involved in cell wall biosynthesis